MDIVRIRLEQNGKTLGEWPLDAGPVETSLLDEDGQVLATWTLRGRPPLAAPPRLPDPEPVVVLPREEPRKEVSDGPTQKTPRPQLHGSPLADMETVQDLQPEVLDPVERDFETNTDRVEDHVPYRGFEDLDTQVVPSPAPAPRREEPPTLVEPVTEESNQRRGQYDEMPVSREQARSTDDDLSLPLYAQPDGPRRGPDDDFTLPLPEETSASDPGGQPLNLAPQARPAARTTPTPSRALVSRGAEVWFRQGGEWMPRGTMTIRQHVQAFGGMVRCDDQGNLVVLPGNRLNGSATLPTGDTVNILAGGNAVRLPPGTSVILWTGELGLYVRSNVVSEASVADEGQSRRASVSTGVTPQRRK